jgi:hypothetical protein
MFIFILYVFRAAMCPSSGELTFSSRKLACTTSLTFNNCTLYPHCIYVFCIYLRTNSDLCHLQHKLIGFYNPDEKCLQCGTDWVFNLLNGELNPTCYLLALLAHHILHVSRIRVKGLVVSE